MSQYNLIFQGTIADGYRLEQVKKNLANIFKVDVKKVETLFTKDSVILKKDLNHESAVKYRQALLKAGAVCELAPSEGSSGSPAVEKAASPDPTVQALKQGMPPPLSSKTDEIVMARPANSASEKTEAETSENKASEGIKDIIAGVVIIGIGFLFGGSVFLGDPGLLDYIFDGLGVFWIGKGIYQMLR